MSHTLTNLSIPQNVWTNLYALAGIAVGTALSMENTGVCDIYISVNDTQPPVDHNAYNVLSRENGIRLSNNAGDPGLWAFCENEKGEINVSVVGSGVSSSVNVDSIPNGTGKGINLDSWGRQKTITDKSLVHGMFTFNVPRSMWKELLNGVEQTTFNNATSVNGELVLSSGVTLNDVVILKSFRNPRYQPNRGHIYSSSIFAPNPTGTGIRDFGMISEDVAICFRIRSDGKLYAFRKTIIDSVPVEVEELITGLPEDFDLSKGNIYDIQMQWRGVGDFKFYVGDPNTGISVLVHTMSLLGALDNLSLFNPALPIGFVCKNLGDEVKLKCGCVDVSSEGGTGNGKVYGSISIDNESGQLAIIGFNQPVLVVRSKATIGGIVNTRDVLSLAGIAYADQRAFFRVWVTRDSTAITLNDQEWADFGDGHLEFLQYNNPVVATPMTFDTAKAEVIFGSRVDQDQSITHTAQFEGGIQLVQAPGSMLIFTLHKENGGAMNGGVTYQFAEDI